MVDGKGNRNEYARPGRKSHEEFLELCALATSGSLSEEEKKRLREHLTDCPECREAMQQFELVVDHGVPALAPELASEVLEEDPSFSLEEAETSFQKRLSEEQRRSRSHLGDAEGWLSPLVVRQSRNFRRGFAKYHLWLPLAAAMVLCTAFGILTYRMGKHWGVEVGRLEPRGTPLALGSQQAFEIASRDSDTANAQLAERNEAISELRREIARERAENLKLKASQLEQQSALQTSDTEKKLILQERDRSAQQATQRQEALQARLDTLQAERSGDVIRAASLEARVAELSRALQEKERTASEEEELLAKDRDIRELMGARDLYVAEVRDVGRTGETEKAFGRLFYTKGKSLIFYAYDLNDQPGLRDTSTFQAWGRRGPDWSQAFKLGMFYEDNVSKKRWVLKFNDRKTLDQIDAVFVTVEPRGGSERPTGKPLLFAYLKAAPNHP
jgi:hypothetical protein